MDNPGTITLRFSTFAALITDVVDSIRHHDFQHIVLINGHGGNIGHLTALSTKLGTTGRPVAFASWWNLVGADFASILDGDLKGVGHACEAETSCYLALDPVGVDLSLAVRTDPDSHVVPIDQSAFSTAGRGAASQSLSQRSREQPGWIFSSCQRLSSLRLAIEPFGRETGTSTPNDFAAREAATGW